MKLIALAIVVLAVALVGAAVVVAHDNGPDCVNTTDRFAENRC